MPSVFLSPSTQEFNLYAGSQDNSQNEEYYTNLIADAMIPYLTASGITFGRNDPSLTVRGSVDLSNAGNYDVHLAIHSNAAPENLSGRIQGSDSFYYPGSASGEALAQLIAANIKTIYPYPDLVGTTPTTVLYELNNTRIPAVLVEVAYHDNPEDRDWIISNIDNIAQALVLSLTQYFGIPFVLPDTVQRGIIDADGFSVFLREQPSYQANTIAMIPAGTDVIITGKSGQWYIVDYNGKVGYIDENFITLI